jgi:hypothetical protein
MMGSSGEEAAGCAEGGGRKTSSPLLELWMSAAMAEEGAS